jgi:hypothetical protein
MSSLLIRSTPSQPQRAAQHPLGARSAPDVEPGRAAQAGLAGLVKERVGLAGVLKRRLAPFSASLGGRTCPYGRLTDIGELIDLMSLGYL